MDELDQIRKLAGISEFKGFQPYVPENMSITGQKRLVYNVRRKYNLVLKSGLNYGSVNLT